MNRNVKFVLMLCIGVSAWWLSGSRAFAQEIEGIQESQVADDTHPVSWLNSLDEALQTAGKRRAPVLLVFGAVWCGPCRLLDEQIKQQVVRSELERWVPVHVDVDKDEATAVRFAITSIPALRILSPDGRQLTGQEGLMQADDLAAWLQQHHAAATEAATASVFSGKLNSVSVRRLLKDFASREPTVRETAISRVLTVPQFAAANIVSGFADASLAERLASLEVLTAWKAPVDGLDPWIPGTVTPERISALEEWVTKKQFPGGDDESSLTASEIIEARRLLRSLISAGRVEAVALREQLARMGPKILPLIRELMADELNDKIRAKLAAARYRVAASDKIVSDWPGGIEQLASSDYPQRIVAMQEFSKRATVSDEQLLGELVADPVPVIREMALHVLARIDGGRANGPLLKMLDDPDANVRAAVLNTLAENASPGIVPAITEYIGREQDVDLIVHAVRCLRGVKTLQSASAMRPLLDHASWRIRAEVVESLGSYIETAVRTANSSTNSAEDRDGLRQICAAVIRRQIQTALSEALALGETEKNAEADVKASASGQLPGNGVIAPEPRRSVLADAVESISRLFSGPEAQPVPQPQAAAPVGQSATSRDAAFGRVIADRTLPKSLYEFESTLTDRFQDGKDVERLAAARCLSMLGHADSVTFVLEMTLHPNQVAATTDLLTVWPWESRKNLFLRLQSIAASGHDRAEIAAAMAEDQDPRAADEIWDVLAGQQLTVTDAVAITEPLWTAYSNARLYNISSVDGSIIKRVNEDSRQMTLNGTCWQPLLGLILLNYTSSPEIGELAKTIVSDASQTVVLRTAALQFALVLENNAEGQKLAISMLAAEEHKLATVALRYLSLGATELNTVPGGFHIRGSGVSPVSRTAEITAPVVLSPPEGLTIAMLRPFLAMEGSEAAAYASHLLALLNHFDEMHRIVDYWRNNPHDPAAQKLLYQAVTSSNAPEYVPLLEDMYAEMARTTNAPNMADFYRTIRSMAGPEIIALRKRIHDDQGEDRLRQR